MTSSELQAIAEKEYPMYYENVSLEKDGLTFANNLQMIRREAFIAGLQYATPAQLPTEKILQIEKDAAEYAKGFTNKEHSTPGYSGYMAGALNEAANPEQSPSPMPAKEDWISVEKGNPLPDYDEDVIWLLENGLMCIVALDKDGGNWMLGSDDINVPKATHWRPLPSPPASQPLTKE